MGERRHKNVKAARMVSAAIRQHQMHSTYMHWCRYTLVQRTRRFGWTKKPVSRDQLLTSTASLDETQGVVIINDRQLIRGGWLSDEAGTTHEGCVVVEAFVVDYN